MNGAGEFVTAVGALPRETVLFAAIVFMGVAFPLIAMWWWGSGWAKSLQGKPTNGHTDEEIRKAIASGTASDIGFATLLDRQILLGQILADLQETIAHLTNRFNDRSEADDLWKEELDQKLDSAAQRLSKVEAHVSELRDSSIQNSERLVQVEARCPQAPPDFA